MKDIESGHTSEKIKTESSRVEKIYHQKLFQNKIFASGFQRKCFSTRKNTQQLYLSIKASLLREARLRF